MLVCRLYVLTLTLCAGTACSSQDMNQPAAKTSAASCLPGERGYLRAQLRGAIDAELDWRGATLQCEGGARPDGRGLRLSFLGPADTHGRQLRLVFGVAAGPGLGLSHAVPTNVTVIVEGQKQLYATQGDDRCTVESLVQEAVAAATGAARSAAMHLYRVAARGYCIDPATALDGSGRLYINRFDFAGLVRYEDNELNAATANN